MVIELWLVETSTRVGLAGPAPNAACAPGALEVPGYQRAQSPWTVTQWGPAVSAGALTFEHDAIELSLSDASDSRGAQLEARSGWNFSVPQVAPQGDRQTPSEGHDANASLASS